MAKYLDYSGLSQVIVALKSNFVQSVIVGSGITNGGSDGQHPVLGVSLSNYTFLSGSTSITGNTANRTYAVGLDSNGNLAVNVPWASGDNKIPLVETSPSQTITIDPYKMYNLGTVSGNTTIIFNTSEEVSGYCAEYLMTFVAGNNCNILLPNGVKYNGGSAPEYISGRNYEIDVCNGMAVVGEFYS